MQIWNNGIQKKKKKKKYEYIFTSCEKFEIMQVQRITKKITGGDYVSYLGTFYTSCSVSVVQTW
jgi:hypothetical protein